MAGGRPAAAARTGGAGVPNARAGVGHEPSRPGAVVPTSVQHCSHSGDRGWWIYTWDRNKPETKTRTPYVCGSWRCPVCATHEAHVTFARMRAAMAGLEPTGWIFAVLTIDRAGYFSGQRWPSAAHAFRSLSSMGRKWLKRIRRVQVKRGWHDTGNRWVAVVEAHRSGWPHVNYLIWCPEMAAELRADNETRRKTGQTEAKARMVDGWLRSATVGAGWGQVSTAEGARDDAKLASYMIKLSGEADQVAGELAKLTQLPLNAPERFRRLRSGVGFLPPRTTDPARTGTMLIRYRDTDGTPVAVPIHKVPAENVEDVRECCRLEADRLLDELQTEELYRYLWQTGQQEAAKRLRPLIATAHGGQWAQ